MDAAQLARARLAFVSEGHRSLTAPRHALEIVEDDGAQEEVAGGAGPPSWRRRLALTRTHLIALGIVLVVVAIALGFTFSRASAEVIPTTPVIESEAPAVAQEQPEEPPAEAVEIRVHVLGSVASPGVVSVSDGAIVADAIAAAGGFTEDAVPGDLNLAEAVAEGMQIKVGSAGDDSYVEGAGAAPASGGGGQGGDKINLNTATSAQLEELPGVGPVMAAAILAWREQNGKFTSVSELQEISGVGPKTFAKLEPLVTV